MGVLRSPIRALLVEDDGALRHGIASGLRMRGFEVIEAESLAEAYESFRLRRPPPSLLPQPP